MNLLAISSIPCWLIPILVGLISAILGYLLGRLLGGGSDVSNGDKDVDVYKNRISKLEADLAACKSSKTSSYSGGNSSSSAAASFTSGTTTKSGAKIASGASAGGTAASAFDADGAKAAYGKKIKHNDLTVVEGIGPKIQELFHNHDVKTWAALSECSVDKCQDVLKSGGKRFEIHKPGTWPEQAKMAALGQWQKLKDWQDKLDGGK